MIVHPLLLLEDNYGYVLRDENSQKTAVVDPSEAAPVIRFLKSKNWQLDYVLNTHHHWDHVGGNLELKEHYNCQVVGASKDKDRIPGVTQTLAADDRFQLGDSSCLILETPGHTLGAIMFYFEGDPGMLFTGDTLFSMGCGRLFEGTAPMMFESFQQLRNLPGETKVYFGHEYTVKNSRFALSLNPDDLELKKYSSWAFEKTGEGAGTTPSTLQMEWDLNPFFCSDAETFADYRNRRDQF